jgi:hypothetical protein
MPAPCFAHTAHYVSQDYLDDGRGFYDDGQRDSSFRSGTRGADTGTRGPDSWTSDGGRNDRSYNVNRNGRDVDTYRYDPDSYREPPSKGRGPANGEQQFRGGQVRGRDVEEDWE